MPALLPLPSHAPPARRGATPGSAALRKEVPEAAPQPRKRGPWDAGEGPDAAGGQPGSLETPTPRVAAAADGQKAAVIRRLVAVIGDAQAEPGELLRALANLRKDLATQVNPPIQEALDAGAAAPVAARLADAATSPAARLEAAWALTNLATGSSAQTGALLEAGAHEALIAALASPASAERPELCDQCLWALANVAGDADSSLRDRLLACGVVDALGRLFSEMPNFGAWDVAARTQVLRSMTWLMSSLCRGRPAPKLEDVDCCFDYFVQVLAGTEDQQMLSEALWGLAYLLDGGDGDEAANVRALRFLSTGFRAGEVPPPAQAHPVVTQVVRCIRRAGDRRSPLAAPALRVIGSLASASNPAVTDSVLSSGALQVLRTTLADAQAHPQLRRDAAWALSNMMAGTPAQAQRLLGEAGVWEAICDGILGGSWEVRRECAWALSAAALHGGLFAAGPTVLAPSARKALPLVAKCLQPPGEKDPGQPDAPLQRALLDAVEAALRYGDEQARAKGLAENPLVATAEECGLATRLEALQRGAQDDGVAKKAAFLFAAWFASDNPEHELDKERTPCSERSCGAASAICGGSPKRRAAFQFGA